MRTVTKEELLETLRTKGSQSLSFRNCKFEDINLSNMDLRHVDFSGSDFVNVNMAGADLTGGSLANTMFSNNCSFHETNFSNANLQGILARYCDFSDSNMEGADIYCGCFEFSNMKGIRYNEQSKWVKLYCPETGPFLGYKKCSDDRLVQLLIPADAKRTSGTNNACRVNKAKVLTIKSFDYKYSYQEAWSLVDDNFFYRVGEIVTPNHFTEERWRESTYGIHIWLTREEAIGYIDS